MKDRIPFADFLRASCAIYIVGFWHLMNYTSAYPGYYNAATGAVTTVVLGIFMMLSGFLIAQGPSRSMANFYCTRLLRIYPLYLGALLLFWFFGISDGHTLLKASIGLTTIFGPSPPTLWFIAVLLLFYAIAPFLIRLLRHPFLFWTVTAMTLVGLGLALLLANNPDRRVFIYFPAFALGLFLGAQQEIVGSRLHQFAIYLLALGTIALGGVGNSTTIFTLLLATTVPLAIMTLLLSGVSTPASRGITVLSEASFVMYLIHRPIYMCMTNLYRPAEANAQIAYLVLVALPVVIIVSWCVQSAYGTATRWGSTST